MTSTGTAVRTVAEIVRAARARTTGPDAEDYDGDLDVTLWLVSDTHGRTWSPSELGRALKIDTGTAQQYLRTLALDGSIDCDSRGAWTRYRARTA